MDHILRTYCPRIDFESYEDFFENFRIEIPKNFNFAYDVVDEWARVEPDKRALVWCDEDDGEKTFTFLDIARLSNRLANALWGLGIRKGDIVMLMLRQRWEYWVCAVALCKIGAIVIPATTQLTKKDIVYRLNASGARALIALDDRYVREQVELASPECPGLEHRLLVAGVDKGDGSVLSDTKGTDTKGTVSDTKGTVSFVSKDTKETVPFVSETVPFVSPPLSTPDGWLSFEQLMADASEDWRRPTGEDATHNSDIMLIYFTSGTTGLAKMCAHSFTHPLGHIITARYWQQVQENRLHCSVSDSGWAKFGWGKLYGQWICGAAVFAYDAVRFDALKLLKRIERYRVTTFCVPPTMYRFMLQEDVASFDLSSVENFTTAGEPLNADVTKRWFEATGSYIREGFGQTEGPVLLATFPWVEPRPGSMGKPSPLLNIQLLDEEGQAIEDGEEGSICVTGLKEAYPPGLFAGYYRNPEATAEAVGGAYYNLHDVAWRDPDGYYTFVGRSDDVIKCSGYRIGPFEVESALVAHPAIVECAVTAVPDEIRGNVVKATVVLARGWEASEALTKELQDHVKTTTAPFKHPRVIEYVAELPKTIGGKIRRAQIRAADSGDSPRDDSGGA
ncbi:MAG: AMP-binding protein [Coriobacteriales bacterium]|jgi:acetyl-CoA synthetase|nr:AMP-binding protein [Coriobacteriales bacterium]